jgi:hypothetical protein
MPIPVERNRLAQKCARPSPDLRYPFDEDRKCSSCGIAPPVGRRFEHSPSGRSLSNSLARAHITGIIDTALAVKSNIFNAAVYLVGVHERSLLATRGGSQPRHVLPSEDPIRLMFVLVYPQVECHDRQKHAGDRYRQFLNRVNPMFCAHDEWTLLWKTPQTELSDERKN